MQFKLFVIPVTDSGDSLEELNKFLQGADSGSNRVLHGGSWRYDVYICRVADRSYNDPG